MLVMPGGADLGYCRTLNGPGNRRIIEVGDKKMEVVGDRELAFYPGICRGTAFPGFVYQSEAGAKAVEVKVDKTVLAEGSVPDTFRCYYNGGGVFVDAPKYKDKGVEILANFTQKLAVDSEEGSAAVVYCKVGDGAAILTSPHPEFVPPEILYFMAC